MVTHLKEESFQQKKKRAGSIVKNLAKQYPDAKCALHHKNALELLVATILSAQCTDERVNEVTKDLFKKYRTAKDYAQAQLTELEKDIHSTGFYRNKAKSIKGSCQVLVEKHNGEVPKTMEEMLELPGVARKTANVVLGTAYGIPTGIVVDTHVARIARRLKLSEHKDPNKIEQDLMKLIPQKEWIDFGHRLIWHGRKICKARNPRCDACILVNQCPSAFAA